MIKKAFLGLILLCSSLCQLQGNDCYSEYWQKIFWAMWENDSFALGTICLMLFLPILLFIG